MNFRAIKEHSRRALHAFMGQPASYYANPSLPDAPVLIRVRPHGKRNMTGDLAGTNLSYAENRDRVFTVVFSRDEVPQPPRGALVVLSATEGYFVDNLELPDGYTITAGVTVATADELLGKVVPEDLV